MHGIGIIGAGVGIRTHAPGFLQTGNARLEALYSPNYGKAVEFASRFGFQNVYRSYMEVCKDPAVDLVVVASPNSFHVEQATYALECGKHVLCEKPPALTEAGCAILMREVNARQDQWFGVNHQLRFSPYIQRMREVIRSGQLGAPIQARIMQQGNAATDPAVQWSWNFDGGAGGGVRWAMGSHLVDLAQFLLQDDAAVVFGAMHTGVRSRWNGILKVPVNASSEFAGSMILTQGTQVLVSAINAAQSGFRFDVDIYLEEGELHFDLESKLRVYSDLGRKKEICRELPSLKTGELDNSISFFSGTFRYFADAIVASLGSPGRPDVRDAASCKEGAQVVRVLDGFLESYRLGSAVRLLEVHGGRDSL